MLRQFTDDRRTCRPRLCVLGELGGQTDETRANPGKNATSIRLNHRFDSPVAGCVQHPRQGFLSVGSEPVVGYGHHLEWWLVGQWPLRWRDGWWWMPWSWPSHVVARRRVVGPFGSWQPVCQRPLSTRAGVGRDRVQHERSRSMLGNAPVESLFGRLKCELGVTMFQSRDQARSMVFEYFEACYNRVRRHSSLGVCLSRRV